MTSRQSGWEVHKDLLSNLYLDQNWSLARVAKHMEDHYGFTRSPGQYERQFRDKWEWTKYRVRGKGWRCVGLKMRKRKRAGFESEVVLNGIVQPSRKVQKELKRHAPELAAYPEDGPSPTMPAGIEVRTPVAMAGSRPTDMRAWTSPASQNHAEDSFSLILPSITKLPSFIGLEILHEAFLSRMTRRRFEQFDETAYPSSFTASFDHLPGAHEHQITQHSHSKQEAPGFHISVWCSTGVVPDNKSAECNDVHESDTLLSAFDMISSPMPTSGVDESTLEHYQILRRVFVLNTSKRLPPDSTALRNLLLLLRSSLSQACLKELLSVDKIAGQDFVDTLLHCAICAKDSSAVAVLLSLGCDPNLRVLSSPETLCPPEPTSVLRLAAEMGELSTVKSLVDAGADVNGVPPEGYGTASPLITAVDGELLNVVEYLLKCGSRLYSRPHLHCSHGSALAVAARRGNLEMTRLLMTAHRHDRARKLLWNRALVALTMWDGIRSHLDGRHEILRMLLVNGADPEQIVYRERMVRPKSPGWSDESSDNSSDSETDSDGDIRSWTALEISAKHGHLDFVATLLEYGARATERAILAAIQSRNVELACFLLGKIGSGSLMRSHGYEMLRHAVDHEDAASNIDLVRALLKSGARPNRYHSKDRGDESARDGNEGAEVDPVLAEILGSKYGDSEPSPLETAAERGHLELLDLLLAAGAFVAPPTHPHYKFCTHRSSVLDRGAKSGNIEVLERLLDAGADIASSKTALVHVIQRLRSPDIVRRLIQGGVDVGRSIVEEYGISVTPLRAAVQIRDLAITQMLLDAGADKNSVQSQDNDSEPYSVLCEAIRNRAYNLVDLLLQSGLDLNNPPVNGHNTTPLGAAVEIGDLDLVLKLLQLGSDPNDCSALMAATAKRPAVFLETLLCASTPASRSPDYGTAALQIAVRTSDYTKVQRLLQDGVRYDIPVSDNDASMLIGSRVHLIYAGLNALGSALKFDRGGYGPVLYAIFAAELDPNAIVDFNRRWTGLQAAVAKGRCNMAQFMIARGADVNFTDPKCHPNADSAPIWFAVGHEHTEMVKLLVSNGARVDIENRPGHSLLALAASCRRVGVTQILLDAGAAVNTNGPNSMCPALETAARYGSEEIVHCLLRAGANASGAGSLERSSALCYAVGRRYFRTVRKLLEAGADPNVSASYDHVYPFGDEDDDDDETYRENMSAIQFCAAQGSVHTAALLLRSGADVNARARIGDKCDKKTLHRMKRDGKWLPPLSPLEEAVAHGNLNMLQLLLDAGARTTGDGTRQYNRALAYARRKCNNAAVRLLEKHHAAEVASEQPDGSAGMNELRGEVESLSGRWT